MTSQLFVEVRRVTVWETNEGAGWEFLLGLWLGMDLEKWQEVGGVRV